MRISDLSSDVCSSDLDPHPLFGLQILVMGEEVLDLLEDDLGQVVLLTHLGVIREGRVDGHADQLLVAAMFVFEVEHRDRTRAHDARSEEHTSELQSLMRISYAVFCLTKTKHHIYKEQYQHTKNQKQYLKLTQ